MGPLPPRHSLGESLAMLCTMAGDLLGEMGSNIEISLLVEAVEEAVAEIVDTAVALDFRWGIGAREIGYHKDPWVEAGAVGDGSHGTNA